jgi:hypothetical protein
VSATPQSPPPASVEHIWYARLFPDSSKSFSAADAATSTATHTARTAAPFVTSNNLSSPQRSVRQVERPHKRRLHHGVRRHLGRWNNFGTTNNMSKTRNVQRYQKQKPQLATIDEMMSPNGLLTQYLAPVPSKRSLIRWFRHSGIAGLKSNPSAKRGGGTPYYHVAAVEKLLRSQID